MCRRSFLINLESLHSKPFIPNIEHSNMQVMYFWGSKVPTNISSCQLDLIVLIRLSSLPVFQVRPNSPWACPLFLSLSQRSQRLFFPSTIVVFPKPGYASESHRKSLEVAVKKMYICVCTIYNGCIGNTYTLNFWDILRYTPTF